MLLRGALMYPLLSEYNFYVRYMDDSIAQGMTENKNSEIIRSIDRGYSYNFTQKETIKWLFDI